MKPKYSGKKIIRAGEDLTSDEIVLNNQKRFLDAMDVLSYWRFTHELPLDQAFNYLQSMTLQKDKTAIFAKRLKRHVSIVRKLIRFENMKLKNMQDIGGCRAVLTTRKKLVQVVRELKRLPEFKQKDGSYRFKDYIVKSKDDGYRGYHLVGKFNDIYGQKKNIEIQLRTRLQHYWATALEIVDLFTDQALKSNQGDEIWRSFFVNISEQFAIMDDIHLFNTFSEEKKLIEYTKYLNRNVKSIPSHAKTVELADELKVLKNLEAFANSLNIANDKLNNASGSGYILLKIDTTKSEVYSTIFTTDENAIAEKEYIKAEKEASSDPSIVIALISTNSVGDIKQAYPNYFADSDEFLNNLVLIYKAEPKEQLPEVKPAIFMSYPNRI